MSLTSKVQSLITAANAVTGESRTDLTSAVQDLKDGYGGGGVQGDWLKIHSEEIVVGQNSISGSKDMVDYLKAAAAEFNEGNLIQFSVMGDPKVNKMYYYSDPSYAPFAYGWRYASDRLFKAVCNNNAYDGYLPAGTRVVLYIAEEVAY